MENITQGVGERPESCELLAHSFQDFHLNIELKLPLDFAHHPFPAQK